MKRLLEIIGLAAIAVLMMGGAVTIQDRGMSTHTARIYWPEKEEVTRVEVGLMGMADSCVPSSPFDLPTAGPRAC